MEIQIGVQVVLAKSYYSYEAATAGKTGVVTEYTPKAKLVEVKVEDGNLWMFYEHEVRVVA